VTQSKQKNELPWQNLNSWLNSMSSLLGEISAVEISTVIVDEITEDIFLPYEVYQAIYEISPGYLAELGINPQLRDRYLRLRRQLELQYALLLTDENNFFYDEQLAAEVKVDLPILAKETTTWSSLPCRLPSPINTNYTRGNGFLSQLLAEPTFKTILRQLGNIKASLDRRNLQLSTATNHDFAMISGITYAQTVIQLDGKIINRYAAEIIKHPQQGEIIKLHQQGVEAGEKQWHKLLRFVTEIIQRQYKFQKRLVINDTRSN
jgi:hypothetical protein